ARGILNHQLKREGCAEGMALSFWCEKVAKVAKLQVALRFFFSFLAHRFPYLQKKTLSLQQKSKKRKDNEESTSNLFGVCHYHFIGLSRSGATAYGYGAGGGDVSRLEPR
ncbi:MAG: hypothetical protein IKR50_04660, partial [Prevotella sp.]|nr:hypothetical protein [Prevotella sp.]